MVETEVQPHRQSCTVDVESNNDLMRSSEHSIFECEAQSPSHPLRSSKKSSALMSRISMFDNQNKPIHLPVKVGSPVVNRKKSRNHRETSFSPHPNSPHAHRKERARNKSMPSPPLQCDPGGLASADESQEEFKIYEGPLLDEPSKIVPVRKSSVQERLMIFEKRNKATLNLTTQSAHVRSNSDGVFSFLNASPRHTRKSSVNVKSTDPASFASPGINRKKAARRIPSERVPSLELQSSPIVSKGSQTARRVRPAGKGTILEHAHSFHSFNRPDDFASPSPSNQKRSWRAKLPSAHDISSLSHHSEASNATNRSDDSGEFASDALEVQPKRSWKMKRQTSTGDTTSSTRAHCDGEISQIDEVPILTNDSASSLEHVQEVRNSTDDFASPYSIQRKSNKLQDRIQKFNKAVSPQPTFLNPHYMDKLVRKESKEHERNSLSFPNRKDLASTLAYQSNDNSIITELPSNEQEARWKDKQLENTETDEIPRISLDKAAETDNENDETKKTKNFDRRGKLKARKSALVGQKDKDKDAVFANDLIHDEDVGSHVLPEFPKEKADEKIIITALRKNFVFEEMEENDIEKLVTAMEEIKVSKGTKIIKQGDEGDYFYVIARGDVAFFVDDRKVGAAGPGNAFGDLALLYKCPRAATVRAEAEPTTLFRIDQKTFRYMTQSQIKKSEEQKKTLLKEIPFLSTLGADDISRLCSVMKPVLFSTGDYIVRKGDNGSSFFIIQDGKVRLTEIFVGGTSYEDISLGIGDYFGEDALISDEPRAANVVALTKGSAFSIDRATVWKVLGDFASLISKAQDRQRLESMKIFRDADLTPADYDLLGKLFTDRKFATGCSIFKKNHKVTASLYIVRKGAVKITASDNSQEEIIGVGGAFGQDHLLVDANSNNTSKCDIVATCTATTLGDCVCGILTLEDCRTIFDTKTLGDRIFSGGNSALEQKRAAIRDLVQSKIKLEDLEKDRIIGEGQFGTVWLVRADPNKTNEKQNMLEFAMKIQNKEDPVRKDGAIEAIKREMTVIHQLNHPFIIDLVDKYETEDQLMMLTEAVKGGELWSRIHREDTRGNWESGMPEADAKFYALVIADTVAYMHRQKIIFRDLKPENVLIDAEGYPTLCDFGFAKYCPDKTFTFCGTPNYLAPEIVLNRGHGAAVDHWALGIVTYEMITGENPFYFEGQDQMSLLQAIVQETFYPLPDTVSKELTNFMSGLLEKDPVQRLGSLANGEKGILKHGWFSALDINSVRNKVAKAPFIPNIRNT